MIHQMRTKIITQREEFHLAAVALVAEGLDSGLKLHEARSGETKALQAVRLGRSPSVDAFSGVLVGL